jgi:hypothetical protein
VLASGSTASQTLPADGGSSGCAASGDAPLVLRDQRLDESLAVLLEALDRPRLVLLDEARIADDIGRENGGEAAVDARGDHGVTSNCSTISISTLVVASGASSVTWDMHSASSPLPMASDCQTLDLLSRPNTK